MKKVLKIQWYKYSFTYSFLLCTYITNILLYYSIIYIYMYNLVFFCAIDEVWDKKYRNTCSILTCYEIHNGRIVNGWLEASIDSFSRCTASICLQEKRRNGTTRSAVKAELKVVGNWLGWVFCSRGTTLWWPNRVQVSQGHANRVSVLSI